MLKPLKWGNKRFY